MKNFSHYLRLPIIFGATAVVLGNCVLVHRYLLSVMSSIAEITAMRRLLLGASVCCVFAANPAHAQVAVQANLDHENLVASADPRLAANKRLVYDFWREVFEGGHMELAEKYLAESYIQHNPTVPTGRAAFVDFFSKFAKPKPIESKVKAPLVSIVAEGDYVIFSFVREISEPSNPAQKYTTTWFDMFRIKDGKIVEHWDAAQKK